ncbi:MAG: PadR family transcriptional regulator [Alphaproteobacteria bacterium]|nr:PadR family transcriptional regulator [Alphaproteobacteria bacterium]
MDVRTVCLGVLTLGDATGYEIRKMFEEGPFQYFTDAGFGSIYPALKKLHDEAYVTLREQAQDNRPDKKVYTITPAGRAAFTAALGKAPGLDKFRSDFLLAIFFEHFLPPGMIEETIEERARWYREKLEHMQSCDRAGWGAGPVFVNQFGQAIYGAAVKFLEENRDTLIESAADRYETEATK